MKNIIREEINRWDPEGLLKIGAPEDEYQFEIDEIAKRITAQMTEDEVIHAINAVFVEHFAGNIPKRTRQISRRILNKMRNNDYGTTKPT